MTTGAAPARAQDFADLKSALVDYSKADLAPRKTCEALANFKSKEIVQSKAVMMPADAAAPAHCRVTGLLAPEIAFEVSLPAQWNGRFYMIGNGGLAGEALDDAGRAAQRNEALKLGFAFAQTNTGHDSAQGTRRHLRAEQPAESDRLRLPRGAPHGDHCQGHRQGLLRQGRLPLLLELLLERRAPGRCSRRSASPTTSTASSPMRRGWIRPASRLARCGIRRR